MNADDPPEMPLAFDDDGNPVLVSHPIYDPEPEPERIGIDAAIVLDFVLVAMSKDAVGERSIMLAHILKTPRASKSLRELGTRLECSHVMAGRRLTRFKAQLRSELKDFAPQS